MPLEVPGESWGSLGRSLVTLGLTGGILGATLESSGSSWHAFRCRGSLNCCPGMLLGVFPRCFSVFLLVYGCLGGDFCYDGGGAAPFGVWR